MTHRPDLTTAADLQAWTAERWQVLAALVADLDDVQWTSSTDVAGWSIKDHVAHVTRWDESLIALVTDGTPRQVTLLVSDSDWHAGGYDAMNEAIRQQTVESPVAEVRARRDVTWASLSALLATYDDETLQRPGKDFGLDYGRHETFLETLVDDLGVHYDQHRQYIERILTTATIATSEDYVALAEQRWAEYTAFLDGLTAEDWRSWTDASGWTVKDHVAHVTAWDDAWTAQATGTQTQRERLALPDEAWVQGIDAINAFLREQTLAVTPEKVRADAERAIAASRAALDTIDLMQEARALGLARPEDERSLLSAFVEDQAEHYELHHRYMDRIVDEGRARAAKQGA